MRIAFGQHVLDTDLRQLERGGQAVRLSPKALTLIEVLIVERPRPVSKRILLDRVWPGVIVEEQNVKNTIVEIREALGDDASCIRTVQRFGYAFCGEAVEEIRTGKPFAKCWLYHSWGATPITTAETYLGRDPSCGLCLDYPGVSRYHARLSISGDATTVEDLGSKNGTWVGSRRISSPTVLQHGDRIRIGTTEVIFRNSSEVDSTLTDPPNA